MATNEVVFVDGFDLYSQTSDLIGLGKYVAVNSASWGSNYGRFGAGGVKLNSYNASIIVSIPTLPTAMIIGMAINFVPNSGQTGIFAFYSANGAECSVRFNWSALQFECASGTNGSTLATGPVSSISGWHYLEVYVQLGGGSPATGGCVFALDGVFLGSELDLGINTNAAGGSSFTSMYIGGNINDATEMSFDDLVIRNVSGTTGFGWFGDIAINTQSPNADAGPNNGVPSSGTSHYPMVDSIPFNISDYITMTNTSGQEELYDIASLAVTPTNVYAVQVTYIAEKTGAGAANLESVISSGGTTAVGSSNALTTSWQMHSDVYMVDPHTSGAWTGTSVNALKVGYEVP
jgi:hypothetical protein